MKSHILVKCLTILVICGILLSCRQKPADPSVVRSGKYKKGLIEGYQKLSTFCVFNSIPGMAIAVSINNQIVWADGLGYSNQELKSPVSPTHKFRIGQVTEVLTALTAAKLIEDGKLLLDKPVTEYLPDISKNTAKYTLRQLAAHCSGLRAESKLAGRDTLKSLNQQITSFIDDSLAYQPGSYVLHTELGYDLIGHIIEKNSQTKYSQVVKDIILDTLKLNSTIPDVFFRITENRSSNYDYSFMAQPINAVQIDLRSKEASAGYLSSVLDLVKISNTMLYPGFLKQESIDLLTTPFKLQDGREIQYSFGWIVTKDIKNRIFYGQHGSVIGGSSAILIYPEEKLVIAMASNIQSKMWEFPIFEIAGIFMNYLHPEKKKPVQEEK